jgi:hypothetical protein
VHSVPSLVVDSLGPATGLNLGCSRAKQPATSQQSPLALTPHLFAELYSHHLSVAGWAGARIIMAQTSFHSETIFDLIIASFSSSSDPTKLADLVAMKERSGLAEEDWNGVLAYCAQVRPLGVVGWRRGADEPSQVLSNLSNFKSFGATKFIPRVSESAFEAVVKAAERTSVAHPLWDSVRLAPRARQTTLLTLARNRSRPRSTPFRPSRSSRSANPPKATSRATTRPIPLPPTPKSTKSSCCAIRLASRRSTPASQSNPPPSSLFSSLRHRLPYLRPTLRHSNQSLWGSRSSLSEGTTLRR